MSARNPWIALMLVVFALLLADAISPIRVRFKDVLKPENTAVRKEEKNLLPIADNITGTAVEENWRRIPDSGKFYISLMVVETKAGEGTECDLKGIKALYGDFDTRCSMQKDDYRRAGSYSVKTFTSEKTLIESFAVYSGRFTFWDGIKDGKAVGGVVEEKSCEDEIIVPFDRNKPIAFVRIGGTKEKEAEIISLPVKAIERQFKIMDIVIQEAKEAKKKEKEESEKEEATRSGELTLEDARKWFGG